MRAVSEPKAKRKRTSGVGGKNLQRGILVREEVLGQLDRWRAAAALAELSLTAWIRRVLERASSGLGPRNDV